MRAGIDGEVPGAPAPGWGGAVAAAAAALLLVPATLAAQAAGQGFGLEVDGGYRVLSDDGLEGLGSGFSAHALGSWAWTSGWEAGFGAGVSFHDPAVAGDGEITNAFGFARYRFNTPAGPVQHVHPFLEGRVGLTRFTATAAGADASQLGSLAGAQGGAEVWVTDAVGFVGALGAEYLSFSAGDGLPERAGWSFRPHVGLKLRY